MSVPQAQLAPQMIYFDILLWSVGFSLLRASLSGFFSGIGRTGVVMLSSITALVLNTVLNYVLIFGKCGFPAMGIQGAAIATLVSGFLGLVILLVAFFRHKIRTEFSFSKAFHFDAAIFRKLLYFGSPAGLELFLNILAFNLVVMIFHSRGDVAATAATIMFNWDLVSFVPLIGLEIAVTSLVGRAMGAGRPDDAHSSVISGLKVGAFYSFWILAAFLFLPGVLVGMFHPVVPQDVFSQAEPIAIFMVRIAAIYVLIEAIYVVLIGALRGAGDTYWAMAISVGLHWMLVGATWLALRTFSLSVELAWTCVVVLFFLSAGVLYWRYQGGAWRSIRVVEQE
jgi:MATE family multidrug resistance protein